MCLTQLTVHSNWSVQKLYITITIKMMIATMKGPILLNKEWALSEECHSIHVFAEDYL